MRFGTVIGIVTFFVGLAVLGFLFGGGCNDGWMSPSIGKQGACSHHSGVNRGGLIVPLISGLVAYVVGTLVNRRIAAPTTKPISAALPPTVREVKPQRVEADLLPADIEHYKDDEPNYSLLTCPRCRNPMRRRLARRGPSTGSEFFGCTRYPRCRGALNMEAARSKAQLAAGKKRT